MHLGVVTGLSLEARRLKLSNSTDRVQVAVATGAGATAREAARRLMHEGVDGLLSFGLAGGLAPSLSAGDIIIASQVLTRAGPSLACAEGWNKHLGEMLTATEVPWRFGDVFGSDSVIMTSAEKSKIHADTGAGAVDIESHHIAAVAQNSGCPFAALRVVVDAANDDLPDAIQGAYGSDGSLNIPELIKALIRRPLEIADVVRLGAKSRVALRNLGRVGRLGGALGPPV